MTILCFEHFPASPTKYEDFSRSCAWGVCDTCKAEGMVAESFFKLPKTLKELPDGYRALIRELAKR